MVVEQIRWRWTHNEPRVLGTERERSVRAVDLADGLPSLRDRGEIGLASGVLLPGALLKGEIRDFRHRVRVTPKRRHQQELTTGTVTAGRPGAVPAIVRDVIDVRAPRGCR